MRAVLVEYVRFLLKGRLVKLKDGVLVEFTCKFVDETQSTERSEWISDLTEIACRAQTMTIIKRQYITRVLMVIYLLSQSVDLPIHATVNLVSTGRLLLEQKAFHASGEIIKMLDIRSR
jgi:hypothetical protein